MRVACTSVGDSVWWATHTRAYSPLHLCL